nr:fatty acid-binding protein 5 [Oryctolagus cuniculus]
MANIQQLVGRWRLVDSQGFDEYMKELGVGLALRKMGGMANHIVSSPTTAKTSPSNREYFENNTVYLSLGEKFEETTADGRKLRSVIHVIRLQKFLE